MTTTVEITRFRASAGRAEALLAARPAMLRDFETDRAGFLGARLIRLANDEWLDIVFWASSEDFAESRRRGGDRPGIQAFFSLIDAVISSEEGTTTGEVGA
ncbi:antibiotic biosynthesis monooxygenase [Micromonospora sp. LAH09]|uniref:antibiotic biosynthesis monooxygenase n=1 Tax=Micromonospora cabrerizensis TaxID=2911213 RepID=UPI001EE9A1EF|nr:antibiotic biosynthesis monooxygenase [Micromonospora cabrerizensis]MCG5472954.1 antibiotic biosynthesis monooxygenase [Micromonospora cabrerizensis]